MWTIHIEERDGDDWLFYTEEFPLLDLAAARQRYNEHRDRLREKEVLVEWALALTDDYGEPVLQTDKAMEGAYVDDGAHEDRTIDSPGAQRDSEGRYNMRADGWITAAEWLADLAKRVEEDES
jgi:hypothetical protein